MCDTIRMQNGNDIETVEQFEKHFQVNAEDFSNCGTPVKDCCLCQIDLETFMKGKPQFYYDCGDWWEKSQTEILKN